MNLHISSDGSTVEFVSRCGRRRCYSLAQWNQIWPRILDRMFR